MNLYLPNLIEASVRGVPYLELNFGGVFAFISLVSKGEISRSIIEFPQEGGKSREDYSGGAEGKGRKLLYGLKSMRIFILRGYFYI